MPSRQNSLGPDQLQDIRDVLMFRIARLATIGDRTGQSRVLREFGLSLGEWRVLGVICARPPATLADIAGELYLDKGQLSRTISSLIDNGLVAHSPSAQDRRQTLFEPTAKGRRLTLSNFMIKSIIESIKMNVRCQIAGPPSTPTSFRTFAMS